MIMTGTYLSIAEVCTNMFPTSKIVYAALTEKGKYKCIFGASTKLVILHARQIRPLLQHLLHSTSCRAFLSSITSIYMYDQGATWAYNDEEQKHQDDDDDFFETNGYEVEFGNYIDCILALLSRVPKLTALHIAYDSVTDFTCMDGIICEEIVKCFIKSGAADKMKVLSVPWILDEQTHMIRNTADNTNQPMLLYMLQHMDKLQSLTIQTYYVNIDFPSNPIPNSCALYNLQELIVVGTEFNLHSLHCLSSYLSASGNTAFQVLDISDTDICKEVVQTPQQSIELLIQRLPVFTNLTTFKFFDSCKNYELQSLATIYDTFITALAQNCKDLCCLYINVPNVTILERLFTSFPKIIVLGLLADISCWKHSLQWWKQTLTTTVSTGLEEIHVKFNKYNFNHTDLMLRLDSRPFSTITLPDHFNTSKCFRYDEIMNLQHLRFIHTLIMECIVDDSFIFHLQLFPSLKHFKAKKASTVTSNSISRLFNLSHTLFTLELLQCENLKHTEVRTFLQMLLDNINTITLRIFHYNNPSHVVGISDVHVDRTHEGILSISKAIHILSKFIKGYIHTPIATIE